MDVPTFKWQEDVLVSTVGDNCVAFRAPPEKVERVVGMAAYALWVKEYEDEWPLPLFNLDPATPDEELLAHMEMEDAYYSDREAYIEEAQEAYREFALLTT